MQALQLLWNPVLTTTLAVILNNGGVVAYTLKEGGNFEMHSLDKSQGVRCGCWSPKGKQIVFGFAQGKLQQHKPDLSLAKTLNAPAGLYQSAFDAIALHWLSTHQFAVILLPHEQNPAPCLYIVNAPKGVPTPNFINYYDICFSSGDLRAHQFTFTHIMPWSLLLVSSANGVEVGVLGTQETGDTPSWKQYNLLGEARIEMPLTANNDETYPVGFVYDTSSSHQIKIDERQLPSMPMVHVLSTDGTLASYNFLNLTAGAPDVCSPPPPITDNSGQFVDLQTESSKSEPVTSTPVPQTAAADMSFAFPANAVTSTPAVVGY